MHFQQRAESMMLMVGDRYASEYNSQFGSMVPPCNSPVPKEIAWLTMAAQGDVLHFGVLNGIRVLTSLAVIWIHAVFVYGTLFYHSTNPSFAAVDRTPFIGDFSDPSYHLNTFWIMSGFLCEYQLSVLSNYYVQRKQKVPYGEYCKFLLNRIARLMPLYVLLVLILYYVHTYERNDLKDTSVKCSLPGVVRSLTFTNRMRYKEPALLCAQHGWTIQNDVHGYVFLVVLSLSLIHI